MEDFNRLVAEQMKTMEKLLFLQIELERYHQIEKQLIDHQQQTKLERIQGEIASMKQELNEIDQIFEKQTEEVIKTYQELNVIC